MNPRALHIPSIHLYPAHISTMHTCSFHDQRRKICKCSSATDATPPPEHLHFAGLSRRSISRLLPLLTIQHLVYTDSDEQASDSSCATCVGSWDSTEGAKPIDPGFTSSWTLSVSSIDDLYDSSCPTPTTFVYTDTRSYTQSPTPSNATRHA